MTKTGTTTSTATSPATMRAAWIERFGGPEELRVGERPTPRPRAGEVLVAVHAAAINPRDWMIRAGTYPGKAMLPRLPFILGSDLAGVVVGHGARLDAAAAAALPVGTRVAAMVPSRDGFGAFAEFAAVRAAAVVPLPDSIDFASAAATPLAAQTALQALRDDAGLGRRRRSEGVRVAVLGASGGVGTFAVQIARQLGASEVVGVASGLNEQLVRDLGATDFVDYKSHDPTEAIRDVDIVFDVIARHRLASCRPMLRPGGVYATTIPSPRAAWDSLRTRAVGLAWRRAPQSRMVMVRSRGDDLRQLVAWLADGRLRAVIDRTAPLDEIGELFAHSRTFRSRGKNVVQIAGD
ncbi:MAG: NADP-dependent oxidoreductase [Acidobacteriota bacterium]